ncbi:MAG: putative glycoside hydrolase [Gammaproteobacteria bacterium]
MHRRGQLPLARPARLRATLRGFGLLLVLVATASRAAVDPAPEGRVRFYNVADSGFDVHSRAPTADDARWMRKHYVRMQAYSTYFDGRLAWYPDAWVYKDSYAIKPAWAVFREHPEWVLRDERGRKLFINWGCANGTCPQFAADIGNPAFRQWWITGARDLVGRGYRGIWVDDVNLDWRISDGNGRAVVPVDARTGRPMTLAAWRSYFAQFTEELRAALPGTEIAHNSIWYAEGALADPAIRRQVDAADYINLERGATDPGLTGGNGPFGLETFFAFIDAVHRRGRAVVLMDYGRTDAQREYGLAAWLLVNGGRDLFSASRQAQTVPGKWWRGYSQDLGVAAGLRYAWRGVLRRDFACGVVLLNQPGAPVRTVDPGRSFQRVDGSVVRAVTLPAATAVILTIPQAGCPAT